MNLILQQTANIITMEIGNETVGLGGYNLGGAKTAKIQNQSFNNHFFILLQ